VKPAVCLIAALAIAAIAAAAAGKPDFSGEWELNAAKSVFGPVPVPTSFTRNVTHAEPSLTIADDQKGGTGDASYTHTYTTDGSETAYRLDGTDIKGTATWEDDALIIQSYANAGGPTISITEKMTLSGGKKTLSDAIHIVLPAGEIDVTYVFERQ
jgi:hypothetical protein